MTSLQFEITPKQPHWLTTLWYISISNFLKYGFVLKLDDKLSSSFTAWCVFNPVIPIRDFLLSLSYQTTDQRFNVLLFMHFQVFLPRKKDSAL